MRQDEADEKSQSKRTGRDSNFVRLKVRISVIPYCLSS